MKMAIANDEAFNFYYRANVDALRQLGEVVFFSPLHDSIFPLAPTGDTKESFAKSNTDAQDDTDKLLYLPGGYPELFLEEIKENIYMRQQIKEYAESGGKVFAECGGFMYLCREIDGSPMCGVLPFKATMNGARLHLGYRQMELNGMTIKGHEFHYSDIVTEELGEKNESGTTNALVNKESAADIEIITNQKTAKNKDVSTAIYRYKNVIAGYTHWYWGETGFPYACWYGE